MSGIDDSSETLAAALHRLRDEIPRPPGEPSVRDFELRLQQLVARGHVAIDRRDAAPVESIQDLWSNGLSVDQIARRTGLTVAIVVRTLAKPEGVRPVFTYTLTEVREAGQVVDPNRLSNAAREILARVLSGKTKAQIMQDLRMAGGQFDEHVTSILRAVPLGAMPEHSAVRTSPPADSHRPG